MEEEGIAILKGPQLHIDTAISVKLCSLGWISFILLIYFFIALLFNWGNTKIRILAEPPAIA